MAPEFDVEATLAKLTTAQKIELLTGVGWWHTVAFPDAGVPAMRMSDGPNGIRGTRFFNGVPSSCFPCSTGLASSFDVDLAQRVGEALGDEARAKGCHIILAPTVNTQRSPLGGRGFESFSEDPHVNGTIAAGYINGIQSKGVASTIKHFVANDQEFQRFSISSEVSERALREIYLKPFQIAIKKSNPLALMTAYNRINGVHASENHRLLNDILRKEWGWNGMVMSDWTGTYSTSASIKAGLDLEMPGPTVMRGKAIERALLGEKLFVSDIDDRARPILTLLKMAIESGIPFDAPEEPLDTPEQRRVMREAAANAVVLLKNERNLLPLKGVQKIAVIGPNAKEAMTSGGGSARLSSTYTVSPLQGITSAAQKLGAEVKYALGVMSYKYPPLLNAYIRVDKEDGALMKFWNASPSSDFLSTAPKSDLGDSDWNTTTVSTEGLMIDGIGPSDGSTTINHSCFVQYSTTFTPDESGTWEIGLKVLSRGNLFFENKLLIDLSTNPPEGDSLLGTGTAEVRVRVPDLEAGRSYKLELRLSNVSFMAGTPMLPCWGAFRLGGFSVAEPEDRIAQAVSLAKESDVVVVVVGLNHDWETEGFDRPDMKLPGHTNRLVEEVLKANPNTVIVNQSGAPVEMPWVSQSHTLLQAFYGGNELGNGLADVLFGEFNPSGKLPVTFPKRAEDSSAFPSFGALPQEHGKIYYNEGIFVGYRNHEIKNIEPLFHFGHGMSYSTFEYSDIKVSSISSDGDFSVAFKIKNTSNVRGKEVAQVYITDLESSLPRPVKELKSFVKVEINAGDTKEVEVKLDRDSLSFYDERRKAWVAEKGRFAVLVGASSADTRLKGETELKETFLWTGL